MKFHGAVYSGPGPALDWGLIERGKRLGSYSWEHFPHSLIPLLPCPVALWKSECFRLYWLLGIFEGAYSGFYAQVSIEEMIFEGAHKKGIDLTEGKQGMLL